MGSRDHTISSGSGLSGRGGSGKRESESSTKHDVYLFFRQLRLLLWKNAVLKKRTPVVTLLETVIPLVIFIILVLMRMRLPPVEEPIQTPKQQPLVSAGLIPLIQSVCINEKVCKPYGVPNGTYFHKLLNDLNAIQKEVYGSNMEETQAQLKNVVMMGRKPLKDAGIDFNALRKELTNLDIVMNETKKFSTVFLTNATFRSEARNLIDKYKQSDFFVKQFNSKIEEKGDMFNEEKLVMMMDLSDKIPELMDWLGFLPTDTCDALSDENYDRRKLTSAALEMWHQIQPDLCANYEKLTMQDVDLKRFEKLNLETHQFLMLQHWQGFLDKNLKILFTPVSEDTLKIVEQMSSTANTLRNLPVFLDNYLQVSDAFRQYLTEKNPLAFEEGVTVLDLVTFLNVEFDDTEPKFSEDLQKNYPNFLRMLEVFDRASCAMKLMLRDRDLNVFEGVQTETEAVHLLAKGEAAREGNRILAVIVFDVDQKGKIGRHVTYKIRQSQSETADTRFVRSSYWYPGTDTHGLNENNYYTYGFLWVQDLVDRAIINFQTGRNVQTPGLYIQKFPAPCYDNDVFAEVIEHGMPLFMLLSWIYFSSVLVNAVAKEKETRLKEVLIVFDVDQKGKIGRHVTYKIRQSQSETADTRFVRSSYWYPGTDTHGLNENNYYTYGFLWVQDLVDRAIINFQTGRNVQTPGLYIQKFPAPCYDNDVFAEVIEHGMPFFMLLSWIYFSSVLVNAVAKEKETRLKESMRMMGLTRTVHWAAWFFTAFLHMQVTLVLLVLLIHFGNLLPQSNPFVLYTFFSIFCVAMICFCFFISCIFNNSQVASAFTGILLVFLHVPFTFIHIVETYNKQIISAPIKSLVCLIPVTPMAMGVKYFTIYEIQKEGIQWRNLNQSPSDGDNFSALMAMVMLAVDSVVYAFLAWYIEAVRPGPYGIPLPWYFPFMRSYWSTKHEHAEVSMRCVLCGDSEASRDGYESEQEDRVSLGAGLNLGELHGSSSHVDVNLFETEPDDLVLGVAIKSLSKKYKSAGKYALRDLTLNMYEGQITALLGHNGAGKSTTMSILCGVQPPSSGTAKIYNKDIRFQMDAIRQQMGMCPQHNVLFENLTVEEHLYLFANLKLPGFASEQIDNEVERLLHDMDLPADRHTLVRKLSSGVQRKLSVAMTFIGDPKLIILDEPTSNVDPQARRAIWDLLIKYKDNHTILMSTHFMDEAQMLGDRIAMISGGVLRCVGTPIYLLNRLGAGYHLTLYRQNNPTSTSFSTAMRQSNKQEIIDFVQRFIGAASVQKFTHTEIEIILPREFVETSNFENLLTELSKNLSRFGLSSFGLRDTSLEEVFFKICESAGNLRSNRLDVNQETDLNESVANQMDDFEHRPENNNNNNDTKIHQSSEENAVDSPDEETETDDNSFRIEAPTERIMSPNLPDVVISQPSIQSSDLPFSNLKRVSDPSLYLNQFVALSKKKLILTAKNPKLLMTQVAFPLLFMLAAMAMAYMSSYTGEPKILRMSTAQYQPYHLPFEMRNMIPVAAVVSSNSAKAKSDAGPLDLVNTLQLQSGIGADCVLSSDGRNDPNWSDFPVPDFLFPERCLIEQKTVQSLRNSRQKYSNGSFSSATKAFSRQLTSVAHYCENGRHRCEECSNAVLVCHNMTSLSGDDLIGEQFLFDTWANDRIVDVSEDSSRFGFDVDDQFQLHAFDHRQRNRYGGLVFKDYVYEPGMVADLPDIYNSLFAKQQVKVYYNSKGYHSTPIYVNAANNAILRANLEKFNSTVDAQEFGITTYSQPIRAGHLPSKNLMDHGNDVVVAMLVLTGFSSLPASFLMHLVYERTHKLKHLQLVSGMHPVIYWLSNLVWDLVVSCIPIFLSYIIMVSIGVRAYTEGQNSLALLYLLLTYVWAVIPVMYLFSFIFNEPATAYVGLGVSNLLTGVIMVIIVYMFDTVVRNDEVISQINSILKACFVIVPIYNLGHGFTYIAFNQILNDFYLSFGLDEKVVEPFDWSATTRGIVINFAQGFVAFFLVILCEYNLFLQISVKTEEPQEQTTSNAGGATASNTDINKASLSKISDSPGGSHSVDPDVKAERERVKRSRDPVRLMNLTKVYTSLDMERFRAVNNVSVGIRQGEIFGLCGSNGSGKTELFKLLTLDSHPSEGTIFIDNRNAAKNKSAIWDIIGYCPQHEALFGEMTGYQHLELYAALRGYSSKSIPKVIKETIAEMDLIECRDKETDTYSGGMKRKLSAALALMGDPKIVVLDDPTAGMDPRSRRFLWTLIKKLNDKGRTVIFASNSMDECERLCSRLAIMVRGSFISLGSVNYLKNRHGDMYNIKCRLEQGVDFSLIANFMRQHLPQAEVVEEHFNVITYEVSAEHLNLPRLFSLLGSHKTKLGIVDYSVSQKTLEMGYMNILRRELLLEQQNKKSNLTAGGNSPSLKASMTRDANYNSSSSSTRSSGLSSRANFVRALRQDQQTGHRLATHAETSS